jgi:glycosyltransferase involved in cell wall biosynthesis
VDNNSTDRTKEIIYNLKENSNRIKYVFAARRSVGAARNEGIKVAQGDIFVFTDADCICPDKWIEEITWPIRFEMEDAVVGFEEDLVKNYWTENIQKRDEIYMQRCSDGKYIRTFDGKNAAIRAKLMKELMFDPNINWTEGLGLALRITMRTKIRYLPSVRVGHFHRSSLKGTIRTYFVRAFWSYRIYRKYKKGNYVRKYIMFESVHPKNWLLFPFWVLFNFIKKPINEAYFILVAELSWRAGLLWSMIKRY